MSHCQKSNGKACCEAKNPCEFKHTMYCCWHEDKRMNKNMFYLDLYGWIDPTYYGVTIPIDLYYCPSCKVTNKHAGDIIDNLKNVMEPPDKYQERITLEKDRQLKEYKKKTNAISLKIEKDEKMKFRAERKLFCEKYGITNRFI